MMRKKVLGKSESKINGHMYKNIITAGDVQS